MIVHLPTYVPEVIHTYVRMYAHTYVPTYNNPVSKVVPDYYFLICTCTVSLWYICTFVCKCYQHPVYHTLTLGHMYVCTYVTYVHTS